MFERTETSAARDAPVERGDVAPHAISRKALRKRLLSSPDRWRSVLGDNAIAPAAMTAVEDELPVVLRRHAELTASRRELTGCFRAGRAEREDLVEIRQQIASIDRQLGEVDESIDRVLDVLGADAPGDGGVVREPASEGVAAPPYLRPPRHGASPSGGSSSLVLDDAVADEEWNDFVRAHLNATAYHDARWRTVLRRRFEHESHYLAARTGGGVLQGLLPLIRVRSRLFGDQLLSMPFLNYGGPLAASREADAWLRDAARTRAVTLGCDYLELRETHPVAGWMARRHKVAMTRSLPGTVDAFERGLGSKLRSQCKRAEREGATVHVGRLELLDDFYRVLSLNMRDLGTPVLARGFFADVLETFPESATLVVVRLGGSPAAGGFLLSHGAALEIPWASSLRRYNRFSVNMLLYRSVLREAISRGHTWFDFGRSSPDSATYRFKRQWGAEPTQMHWHFDAGSATVAPGLDPNSARNRLLSTGWRYSPLFVTNRLGPWLSRSMP